MTDFQFVILVIPYMRARDERVALAGSDPARWQVLMSQVRDQMQFAESVGYDGFCMTEQHMQVEGIETTTNPILWDLFVARHTERMRVGQLGMNLTVVNPIQLAEDLAMLDHFTGGRMFAGFSRGNTPRWTATFGQHIDVMSTESDKSDADQRNRRAFYENWHLVKSLWTQDKVSIEGEFWNAPQPVEWHFPPTDDFDPGAVTSGPRKTLRQIGIVPRPLQQDPHPPVYAPFSYSMETSKFWAREGGKMVSFVAPDKQGFIHTALEVFLDEAANAGRSTTAADALALGGHLTMGRTPAESADLYAGFEHLFNWAYNAAALRGADGSGLRWVTGAGARPRGVAARGVRGDRVLPVASRRLLHPGPGDGHAQRVRRGRDPAAPGLIAVRSGVRPRLSWRKADGGRTLPPTDTTSEAAAVQRRIIAAKSPEERAAMAMAMSALVRELALAGIRDRAPDLDEEEVVLLLIERMHGKTLADAVRDHRGR